MKMKINLTLACALGVVPSLLAQVTTTVDCDLMGLVVNVGSQPTMLSLYHPGGYLTWPSSENVMHWEFTDEAGTLVHEETLVDNNFISFQHNVPTTDTLFVSVLLTNDSAIHNGNPVACWIDDYLTWEEVEIVPGTFMGYWTLGGSVGYDANEALGVGLNLPGLVTKSLVGIFDASGREALIRPNTLLFFVYDDGSVEKRFVIN